MTNHQIDLWMKKLASGDDAALETLYKEMHKPVYFYVLRLAGDPATAEDVMQDTFLSVYRKAALYRAEGKGRAWIFTIAKNLTVDALRRQSRTDDFSVVPELPTADDFTVGADTRIDALRMLEGLTAKEKNLVLLRLLSDMTLTEAAKELDIPVGTAFWTYNNAIQKMRRQFSGGKTNET